MTRLLIRTLGFTLCTLPAFVMIPADPPQTPAVPEDIKAAIQKYLAGGSDKEEAWKNIEAYDLKADQVEEFAKTIHGMLMKGPTHTGGSKATEFTYREVDGKDYSSKYYAYFSGEKDGGKKYPLFVILHSGGGKKDHSGDAARELTWWPKQKDAIAVAPVCRTDFSPNVHWNSRPNYNMIPAVIEEMIRSYPVDTNRIYILGCSMGGWAGWSQGSLHADRIAAVVSHSGGVWLKANYMFPLENLLNVPFYIHHGGNENPPWDKEPGPRPAIDLLNTWKKEHGGYELEVVNKEGQGHCSSSPKERSTMMQWLLNHKRDPYPKKILWKLTDSSSTHFSWLRIQKAKGRPSFVAERKDNRIEITSKNFKSGLTVYINSAMVDMSKPVTVVMDGEQKFSGVVKPSLAALVESLQARKDLEMYFWGKISF